jgi:phosphonate metabolism-associated iron-containing alcohol dehydrogenase
VWRYRNPVEIIFGPGKLAELPKLIGGRRFALVTYGDPPFLPLVERIRSMAGEPALIIDDIAPNPDCVDLDGQAARFASAATKVNVIVAVGGGSVIDSAKVFATADGKFERVLEFLRSPKDPGQFHPLPIIAIPTTAGTGSEVTPWATVWDGANDHKYSLSLPDLFPTHAVIDPELMVGKPRQLTISTGLDALSHALESIWNVNVNPVSMNYAVAAAIEILDVLPRLVADLSNLVLRSRMAQAALFAGCAFSNTKTAIAHSLSYPITLRHHVPHGLACSFTLPLVLSSVVGCGGLHEQGLRGIFGADLQHGVTALERLLRSLDVSTSPQSYGAGEAEWLGIIDEAFGGERGRNFIGDKDRFIELAKAQLSASGGTTRLKVTS